MGIKEAVENENRKTISIEIQSKNFSDFEYWLRDIKKKLKSNKILRIKIRLDIDYFEGEEII